jgi:hypothetical protein
MSRPHEDRERHTLVDHRPGGSAVLFTVGSWLAIGIARVQAERTDACVSAYETLTEEARTSNVHAGPAAIFASANGRRVVTLVGVRGHDGFRHLTAAWDDHHRFAEHRVVAESVSFALYEVAASIGAADIDSATHDVYVYERVERPATRVCELFASLGAATDFRGATVCHDDGDIVTVILSRFAHFAAYDGFRAGRAAMNALGSPGDPGETGFAVHSRKTIALLGAERI